MATTEVFMSNRQYTDEFKAEAVKQVTERGFRVADVAQRLGVSTHSLYEWLRKAKSAANADGEGLGGGPATEGRDQASDRGARHPKKCPLSRTFDLHRTDANPYLTRV